MSGNTTAMFEQQAEHIAYIIAEAMARGANDRRAEPGSAGRLGHDDPRNLDRHNRNSQSPCTPGYYNNEGGGGGEGIRSAIGDSYAPGFYAFERLDAGGGATRATWKVWCLGT